uniref:Uncharacterized protein n=1 Tax=Caenorhabditis japonica TaxID=281687 RepID=A0A8R1E7B3_CAEJA
MRWQHHDDNYDYFPRMRINRKNLIHLRFADDIILMANNSMTASLRNGFPSKVTNNNRTIRIEDVNQ